MQRNPLIPALRQCALLTVARLYAIPSTFGFSAASALLICRGVSAAAALVTSAKKPTDVAIEIAFTRAMECDGFGQRPSLRPSLRPVAERPGHEDGGIAAPRGDRAYVKRTCGTSE